MITPIISHHIDHPSAWKSIDFKSNDDFARDLEPRHIKALDLALNQVREAGLGIYHITKANFPLDDIQDFVNRIKRELMDGRGFLVIGDRLGYVMDYSDSDPLERAYRNKYELSLHTDLNELIGMLNIRTAARGGESQYASAIAVHNEIFATRPELLRPLYEGFHYHGCGEEAPGQEPVTPHKVPIFSTVDDVLSCRFVDAYMPAAAKESGIDMPAELLEAIACFQEIAARDDFRLDMLVQPGEMTFGNNFIVMHARSAFENDPTDANKKRLFLRLWLDVKEAAARPHVPEVAVYDADSITKQEGRTPVYAGDAWSDYESKREHVS